MNKDKNALICLLCSLPAEKHCVYCESCMSEMQNKTAEEKENTETLRSSVDRLADVMKGK